MFKSLEGTDLRVKYTKDFQIIAQHYVDLKHLSLVTTSHKHFVIV